MKLHANARLSPKGRQHLIDRIGRESGSVQDVAESVGVSERTARKWLARYRVEGPAGLVDRPSAPNVVANRTGEETIEAIAALRRLRFTGPEIAEVLDRPVSTVSGILTRIGIGKLGRLGLEPAERYEREVAGELLRDRLGVRAYRDRRRHPPGLRRSPPRRKSDHRDRVCSARSRSLRATA